jgi:hypothetical protein
MNDALPNSLPFSITLTETAIAFLQSQPKPSPELVTNALLNAEKTAKQERLTLPGTCLSGRWRLCFATGTRKGKHKSGGRNGITLGKGYYLPKFTPAYISFTPKAESNGQTGMSGTIQNQIQLGGLRLRFTGPYRYTGKKNLLAFDFTEFHIDLFNRPIFQRSIRAQDQSFEERAIAKLPFFAFFWATEQAIAARGRGGGLALWVRE